MAISAFGLQKPYPAKGNRAEDRFMTYSERLHENTAYLSSQAAVIGPK